MFKDYPLNESFPIFVIVLFLCSILQNTSSHIVLFELNVCWMRAQDLFKIQYTEFWASGCWLCSSHVVSFSYPGLVVVTMRWTSWGGLLATAITPSTTSSSCCQIPWSGNYRELKILAPKSLSPGHLCSLFPVCLAPLTHFSPHSERLSKGNIQNEIIGWRKVVEFYGGHLAQRNLELEAWKPFTYLLGNSAKKKKTLIFLSVECGWW